MKGMTVNLLTTLSLTSNIRICRSFRPLAQTTRGAIRFSSKHSVETPPSTSKTIFVGNVPYGTPAETFQKTFASIGAIHSVWLPDGRGFGKVNFESPESAIAATKCKKPFLIAGRSLNIELENVKKVPLSSHSRRKAAFHTMKV